MAAIGAGRHWFTHTTSLEAVINRVRLGIIGVGRMGRVHMTACQDSESVQITAVAETNDGARAKPAAAGMTCYQDAGDLVAAWVVDGVITGTPTPTHQDLSIQALAAGLPVLCEKPCGPTAAGVQQLEASNAAKTALWVGYWRPFRPAARGAARRDRLRRARRVADPGDRAAG